MFVAKHAADEHCCAYASRQCVQRNCGKQHANTFSVHSNTLAMILFTTEMHACRTHKLYRCTSVVFCVFPYSDSHLLLRCLLVCAIFPWFFHMCDWNVAICDRLSLVSPLSNVICRYTCLSPCHIPACHEPFSVCSARQCQ